MQAQTKEQLEVRSQNTAIVFAGRKQSVLKRRNKTKPEHRKSGSWAGQLSWIQCVSKSLMKETEAIWCFALFVTNLKPDII